MKTEIEKLERLLNNIRSKRVKDKGTQERLVGYLEGTLKEMKCLHSSEVERFQAFLGKRVSVTFYEGYVYDRVVGKLVKVLDDDLVMEDSTGTWFHFRPIIIKDIQLCTD